LKITIIAPGLIEIPPKGWGAIEAVVWDYKNSLENLANEVTIINTQNEEGIIYECNKIDPDLIHIHYDRHYNICEKVTCKNIIITSHFGYIQNRTKYREFGFTDTHWGMIDCLSIKDKNIKISCLSKGIYDIYKEDGVSDENLFFMPNGVDLNNFHFSSKPKNPKMSIYLAKIQERKKQYLYQGIPNLFFVGDIEDQKFDRTDTHYLGPLTKSRLYLNLTHFANTVLLSDGEAHPLSLIEGMACGLGVVCSEEASANLDASLPFIDVIDYENMKDIEFVKNKIEKNRKKSLGMRKEIRKYTRKNFSWHNLIKKHYLPEINQCPH